MNDTERKVHRGEQRAVARPRFDAGVALIALLGLLMVLQIAWILGRAGS